MNQQRFLMIQLSSPRAVHNSFSTFWEKWDTKKNRYGEIKRKKETKWGEKSSENEE